MKKIKLVVLIIATLVLMLTLVSCGFVESWIQRTKLVVPSADEMVPTKANLGNLQSNYLFVYINGENYRYERSWVSADSFVKSERIKTFELNGITYSVYSTKDYPDMQVLLLENDRNTTLYVYAPPKACEDGAVEKALSEGYAGEKSGEVMALELWQEFYQKYSDGILCEIKLFEYYEIDDYSYNKVEYEARKEDYPSMSYYKLQFDGEKLIYTDRDGKEHTYNYLMKYDVHYPANEDREEINWAVFYLVDDKSVTYELIMHQLTMSDLSKYTIRALYLLSYDK